MNYYKRNFLILIVVEIYWNFFLKNAKEAKNDLV